MTSTTTKTITWTALYPAECDYGDEKRQMDKEKRFLLPYAEISSTAEDLMTILNDELDGVVSGLHVCHFAFETVIPHDSGCKDDGEILWRHLSEVSQNYISASRQRTYQVLLVSQGHAGEVEDQKL